MIKMDSEWGIKNIVGSVVLGLLLYGIGHCIVNTFMFLVELL